MELLVLFHFYLPARRERNWKHHSQPLLNVLMNRRIYSILSLNNKPNLVLEIQVRSVYISLCYWCVTRLVCDANELNQASVCQ